LAARRRLRIATLAWEKVQIIQGFSCSIAIIWLVLEKGLP
jgi:hypothetical protein